MQPLARSYDDCRCPNRNCLRCLLTSAWWHSYYWRSGLVLTDQQQQQQHPLNGPLYRTTRVSRYQKNKTNLDLVEQKIVNGTGISWAICKSAPWPRQMTMPAPHHSVFYRPDALSATQPTASKHWTDILCQWTEAIFSWVWQAQVFKSTSLRVQLKCVLRCQYYIACQCYSVWLKCFDAVGWAAGRASGL